MRLTSEAVAKEEQPAKDVSVTSGVAPKIVTRVTRQSDYTGTKENDGADHIQIEPEQPVGQTEIE